MRWKVRKYFEVSAGKTRVGFVSTARGVAGKLEHVGLEQKERSEYCENGAAFGSVVDAWVARLKGQVGSDCESLAHWCSAETERRFAA